MLIQIHAIQNHSPANLNRDDLGAPKTCYFGGVLRSRISSQCIKRSIRMSDEFHRLLGGVRTRRLAKVIAQGIDDGNAPEERAAKILELCGFKPKKDEDMSKALVYTTKRAAEQMASLLKNGSGQTDEQLADQFARLIAEDNAVPDMALMGRMLEPDKSANERWKQVHTTTVEAALQVAHAMSTHEARPEVDYYVAKDDVPGADAGAGYLDEAMFASACFYKYFSIHWETLVTNLKDKKDLAAHTVGAFIRGAALVNPSGKQNSFAAHNLPDGMLLEIGKTPISYANAFARPAAQGEHDIISQSIAQLAQYVHDLDTGYGKPHARFWFSPNLRHSLTVVEDKDEIPLATMNMKSLDEMVHAVIAAIGDYIEHPLVWEQVREVVVDQG